MGLIVETRSGKIQGHMENGLIKFLGIPFAEQPKGKLRFKRAVAISPWQDILEAKEYGSQAPQDNHNEFCGTEDCLTLNILRPMKEEEKKLSEDKLPVIVWIHGGGYNIGSACDPMYHGDAFAKDDIIYVNFQYRLNVLGFYDFTTFPGCEDFESNCGLSDMIAAIQWIHDNIAAFGGDPDRITLAGESAGGAAIATLLAVPAVKGCFSQVIIESGLCNCVMTKNMQHKIMKLFIQGMGWTEEDLPQLRTIDPLELVHGHNYVEYVLQYNYPGTLEACPVIDDLLPERPLDAIAKGCAEGIKMIIGTNLHEGTMFVRPEGTTFPCKWEMIREMFRREGHADQFEKVKEYYSRSEFREKYGSPFVHFATDYGFQMPSTKAAILQSKYGETRMYRYEHINKMGMESGLLAAHAFELPNVFALENPMFFDGETESVKENLIEGMHGNWVKFIKGEELTDWPLYETADSPVMIFDEKSHVEELDKTEMLSIWGDMRFYED